MGLLRERGVARVLVEAPGARPWGDLTAPFVYARLKAITVAAAEGYDPAALEAWRARLTCWAAGRAASDLPCLAPDPGPDVARPCHAHVIAGDKVRAPDAARALLRRLPERPAP